MVEAAPWQVVAQVNWHLRLLEWTLQTRPVVWAVTKWQRNLNSEDTMATEKTPVITNARFVRNVWTTNPESYYDGKMGKSQHHGPLVGWTPKGEPVYGHSGNPLFDQATGKFRRKKKL